MGVDGRLPSNMQPQLELLLEELLILWNGVTAIDSSRNGERFTLYAAMPLVGGDVQGLVKILLGSSPTSKAGIGCCGIRGETSVGGNKVVFPLAFGEGIPAPQPVPFDEVVAIARHAQSLDGYGDLGKIKDKFSRAYRDFVKENGQRGMPALFHLPYVRDVKSLRAVDEMHAGKNQCVQWSACLSGENVPSLPHHTYLQVDSDTDENDENPGEPRSEPAAVRMAVIGTRPGYRLVEYSDSDVRWEPEESFLDDEGAILAAFLPMLDAADHEAWEPTGIVDSRSSGAHVEYYVVWTQSVSGRIVRTWENASDVTDDREFALLLAEWDKAWVTEEIVGQRSGGIYQVRWSRGQQIEYTWEPRGSFETAPGELDIAFLELFADWERSRPPNAGQGIVGLPHSILSTRRRNRGLEFHVEWEGGMTSWESQRNLKDEAGETLPSFVSVLDAWEQSRRDSREQQVAEKRRRDRLRRRTYMVGRANLLARYESCRIRKAERVRADEIYHGLLGVAPPNVLSEHGTPFLRRGTLVSFLLLRSGNNMIHDHGSTARKHSEEAQ
jgi:hypothetical protein